MFIKSFVRKKSNLVLVAFLSVFASACEQKMSDAETILSRMSLEEKIGQVIQADISSVTPEEAKQYNLGSVLNGGNSAPGGGKTADWQDWVDLADEFWLASTDKSDGGVGIPIMWGTDAVHGHNNLQSATIFPHNIGLGATRDANLLERIGEATALEVRATGLDWVFAPTIAVARDYRWGRTYESYSENRQIVSDLGAALVRGLQGKRGTDDFLSDYRVVATAKHFVGDGGTEKGIDKGDTVLSMQELRDTHAFPYEAAFAENVQTVMASFSSVNGKKMHGRKDLLTGLLREKMHFNGFVVGDWNGHAEIPGCSATDCPEAFMAGVDMYMAPESWKGIYNSLKTQVEEGVVPMERLDEAVLRILQVKLDAGLFEAGLPSERVATKEDLLGNEKHRATARESVRKSLVLLKNNNKTLPAKPNGNILVVGEAARSMKHQTGGWTLSWQGNDNSNEEFETGETIFEGLESAIVAAGGKAHWSVDGSFADKPDVAFMVYGESPYAEYHGDRMDLIYEFEGDKNLELIKKFKSQNIPVVSIFVSGRPLWANRHINLSDAFVAAWLPGTEAGGIADVLLEQADGSVMYDFTGKLPFAWPTGSKGGLERSNSMKAFQLGYGLSYGDGFQVNVLPVSDKVRKPNETFRGIILSKGKAADPLAAFLGDMTNSNTPAPTLNVKSLGGSLISSGTDYLAQEDSRRLTWTNDKKANISVRFAYPFDLTKLESVEKLAISMTLRVEETGRGAVKQSMVCGEACEGELNITPLLKRLPDNSWEDVSIPVSCFTKKGLNPTNVEIPLKLEAQEGWKISVHKAALVSPEELTSCP